MSKVTVDVGMSLDGFIAGPNAGPQNALGDGGHRIHQWVYDLEAWRERQSLRGGQTNRDDEVLREAYEHVGAFIMGRRMFGEGEIGWPDPPPFQAPVFVLTNHGREPWIRGGGTTFTFVTDGIESALEQAREAAGETDVRISGGANTIDQFAKAGLVDEVQFHLAPVILGRGVKLFETVGEEGLDLEKVRLVDSPGVTHISFRVAKQGT
jgi:dihydrofolate reductase